MEAIEIRDLILMHETPQAYLVRPVEGQLDEKAWLPKSQVANIKFGDNVEDEETGMAAKIILSLEIPEWLAKQTGWSY